MFILLRMLTSLCANRVREACAAAEVEVQEVPSMSELGKACSVAVKTAAAALLAESFG